MRIRLLAASIGFATAIVNAANAAEPNTVASGAYNAIQAARGNAVYTQHCEACHGVAMKGADAPPLTGVDFRAAWIGATVGDMFERIRNTMPATDPKSLSAQQYADLIAAILAANGYPAGAAELPAAIEQLRQRRIPPSPSSPSTSR